MLPGKLCQQSSNDQTRLKIALTKGAELGRVVRCLEIRDE